MRTRGLRSMLGLHACMASQATADCKRLLLLPSSSTHRPCLLCIPCSPAPALFHPQLTAEPSTSTPRQ